MVPQLFQPIQEQELTPRAHLPLSALQISGACYFPVTMPHKGPIQTSSYPISLLLYCRILRMNSSVCSFTHQSPRGKKKAETYWQIEHGDLDYTVLTPQHSTAVLKSNQKQTGAFAKPAISLRFKCRRTLQHQAPDLKNSPGTWQQN